MTPPCCDTCLGSSQVLITKSPMHATEAATAANTVYILQTGCAGVDVKPLTHNPDAVRGLWYKFGQLCLVRGNSSSRRRLCVAPGGVQARSDSSPGGIDWIGCVCFGTLSVSLEHVLD